jgi:hypothetical protein
MVVEQRQVHSRVVKKGRVGQGGLELRLGVDPRVVWLFDPLPNRHRKKAVKLLSLVHWEARQLLTDSGWRTADTMAAPAEPIPRFQNDHVEVARQARGRHPGRPALPRQQ